MNTSDCERQTDRQTEIQRDGWKDGQTDGRVVGRTDREKEQVMLCCPLSIPVNTRMLKQHIN